MKTKHAYAIATIEGGHYGLRDFPDGMPGSWFALTWEGSGVLIALQHEEANQWLIEHRIRDVGDLNGRQCVIDALGVGACEVKIVHLLEE